MSAGSSAGPTRLPAVDIGSAATTRQLGHLAARSPNSVGGSLPLTKVRIVGRVVDRVAEVSVSQTFVNSYAELVEAVYIFPLPGGCSVSHFEMTSGGQTICAVLAEREEARDDYQQALERGESAAILEQERDDVFTVSVGNLPAGEEATIRLVYSERLPFFENGCTELRVPLVVAPRYIPGFPLDGASVGDGTEPDTDEVPDASRITPPRLAPGFDSETSLRLEIELCGTVSELDCSQHAVRQFLDGGRTKIELSRTDELMDRDFVLRWRLVEDGLTPSLAYYRGDDGQVYGLLSIMATRGSDASEAEPRDVVFVVDRSGSMGGAKMASATRACECLLKTLGPADRFGILAFDDRMEWFQGHLTGPQLMTADEDGLGRADRWVRGIEARGGTEASPALAAALDLLEQPQQGSSRTLAIVFITDGAVGNEGAVLERVQRANRAIRLFAVGVDTAISEGFLTNLARLGRGTSTFVAPGTALEDALVSIGRDIGRPLVTDLTLEGPDGTPLDSTTFAPTRFSDLFGGRATSVSFRTQMDSPIRVRGKRPDGSPYEVVANGRTLDLPAIAHLWGRARVSDLEDQYRLQPERQDAIRREIISTSIDHRVLSRFTAYLVVNREEVVGNSKARRKIVQPVHNPAGWQAQEELIAALSVREQSSPDDSAMQEIRQLTAEALALAERGDLSMVEKLLVALMERLVQMRQLMDEEARWVQDALHVVEESLTLLPERHELCRHFEGLVTRLGSLSLFGNRRFDEAVATVEDLRTVLRRLQAVDGRLKDLLNKLQSLVLMFFESRDAERRRFWDRSV